MEFYKVLDKQDLLIMKSLTRSLWLKIIAISFCCHIVFQNGLCDEVLKEKSMSSSNSVQKVSRKQKNPNFYDVMQKCLHSLFATLASNPSLSWMSKMAYNLFVVYYYYCYDHSFLAKKTFIFFLEPILDGFSIWVGVCMSACVFQEIPQTHKQPLFAKQTLQMR